MRYVELFTAAVVVAPLIPHTLIDLLLGTRDE